MEELSKSTSYTSWIHNIILNKTYKRRVFIYCNMKTSLKQSINTGYEKYNKVNSIDGKIYASFGGTKIIGVINGYGKSASSRVYKLLLSTCINNTRPNGQIPQSKLDQRSLINAIESVGEILRGSGILLTKTGSQKDWRGTNTAGQVEDEDIQLYQQIEVFLTLQIG